MSSCSQNESFLKVLFSQLVLNPFQCSVKWSRPSPPTDFGEKIRFLVVLYPPDCINFTAQFFMQFITLFGGSGSIQAKWLNLGIPYTLTTMAAGHG